MTTTHRKQFARLSFLTLSVAFIGCSAAPQTESAAPQTEPATHQSGTLDLALQVLEAQRGSPPQAIRVTWKNGSSAPISFEEPRPRCPEVMDDSPVLGLLLTDSAGRQSPWTPILTQLFRANLAEPSTQTLAPGKSWSMDVNLEQLYVWGPCGPAQPISELLRPDAKGVQMEAMIVPSPGVLFKSPPIQIAFTIPSYLFEEPGSSPPGAEPKESAEEMQAAHASVAREQERRHAGALRALRREFSKLGPEPDAEGKLLSDWLAVWTDESLQFAREGTPEEKERSKAERAILKMGAKAVPFLMQALEVDYAISERVAALLREFYEAGKVSDRIFVKALRGGPEAVQRGVLEALDPELSFASASKKAALLSDEPVAVLAELLNEPDSAMILEKDKIPAALGRPGQKAAVPVLVKALRNGDDMVRLSAVHALGVMGQEARAAIPELRALSASGNAPEKRQARSVLISLGENLPDLSGFLERMEQYLRDRTAKEPIVEANETALASWLSGVDGLFFVVDRSGKPGSGFNFSKTYIPRALSAIEEGGEFGVIYVDRRSRAFPSGGKPAKWTKEAVAEASEFVRNMEGGHASCPIEGFNAALDMAAASSARKKAIIYIGDGGGTCQMEDEVSYLERMCKEVTSKNAGKAEIRAVGAGTPPICEAVLLYLVEQNGGTYRRLLKS